MRAQGLKRGGEEWEAALVLGLPPFLPPPPFPPHPYHPSPCRGSIGAGAGNAPTGGRK